MLTKTAIFFALIALTACAPAFLGRVKKPPLPPADSRREIEERLRGNPRPAILFIGNSYSFGVPAALEKIAAEHGKAIRTGHSAYSGWTLARHAAHEPTLRKIRDGHWDIVVLQEYSRIPALPSWQRNRQMFPAVHTLAAAARHADAIPILYQTWGRRDDFPAMNRRIRAGYQAASAAGGGLFIVPIGDFWQREISASRGGELFMDDGSHPTAAGNRLTAAAFFEILFR